MKKIKLIIVILSVVLILIPILFGILVLQYVVIPDNVKINFYLNETNQILEGDVYFEDYQSNDRTHLGRTKNGTLEYNYLNLYPGKIVFIGNYENMPFEYVYQFTKVDLDLRGVNYIVTPKNLEDLEFVLTTKEVEIIKGEIFKWVNEKRIKNNIEILDRNRKLDKVAQDYSRRMQMEGFYAHTDPGGYDIYDRLKKENIFFSTATEDLSLNYVYSDTEIAKEIVEGWIASPGHRIPIIDTDKPPTWNNIGIGLSCVKLNDTNDFYTCYSVAVFAGFNIKITNYHLKEDYVQLIELYPIDLGLDFVTTATITFKSSRNAKLILTSDKTDFERYVDRENIKGEIFREIKVNNFHKEVNLNPGDSLLIHADNQRITYDLDVIYNE